MDHPPTADAPPAGLDLTPIEAAECRELEADEHIRQREWLPALQALQKAIYFRPDHAPLHAKLARVYWDLCDLKSAMASYRKLFAIDPNPGQRIKDQFAALLDLHGYSLLMLGESPAIALAYLTEAIQLNSLDETYWLHRALAHIHANCLDKALKDVDHCVNLNGKDVEYFVLRAKLHWKLHMHEKATSDIQKAARLCPEHPEVVEHEQRLLKESQAIYAQACRHLLVRDFAAAIKSLTNAAELSPEETKIYLLRAAAHRELGDLAAALRDADKALSCHTHRLELEKQRLQAQTKKIRHHQHHQSRQHHGPDATTTTNDSPADEPPGASVDHTKEYREIATQRILILNDLALKFLHDKSYQVALNSMNQVIQGQVEIVDRFGETFVNPQYYINRGDAYRGLENYQAALADYRHASELNPASQEMHSRIALIHYHFGIELFNHGRFDKAELEFAKAIQQDPNVPSYHVRKGDAARFQEKHHVASIDYQNAMRLNPSDGDTYNKLLQYAVDPLRHSRPGIGESTGRSDKPSKRPGATSASTMPPSNQQRDLGPAPSSVLASGRSSSEPPSDVPARTLEDALAAYRSKNRRVKDLLHNRPVLPSSSARRQPSSS